MAADDGEDLEDLDAKSSGTADTGDSDEPGGSPIVVSEGGGAFIRLPIPVDVVDRLGGSSLLERRLHPILNAEPAIASAETPDTVAVLTSQYDQLFLRLRAIADKSAPGGGDLGRQVSPQGTPPTPPPPQPPPPMPDPGSPIRVDPGGGFSVSIPIPVEIVAKLGGSLVLADRLRPILAAEPLIASGVGPQSTAILAKHYGQLFDHLEAIASRRRPE